MEELVYTTLNECERTATALEELIFPTIDSLKYFIVWNKNLLNDGSQFSLYAKT